MVQKRFKGVFTVPKRPNYEALSKAVEKNPRFSPETKAKIQAKLKRKARGY